MQYNKTKQYVYKNHKPNYFQIEIWRHRKIPKVIFASHYPSSVGITGPRLLICQISPLTSSGSAVSEVCAGSFREISKSCCALVVDTIAHPPPCSALITPSLTLSLPQLGPRTSAEQVLHGHVAVKLPFQSALMDVARVMFRMCQYVKYPVFSLLSWRLITSSLWMFCSFASCLYQWYHQ